jgi:hypothetical protein
LCWLKYVNKIVCLWHNRTQHIKIVREIFRAPKMNYYKQLIYFKNCTSMLIMCSILAINLDSDFLEVTAKVLANNSMIRQAIWSFVKDCIWTWKRLLTLIHEGQYIFRFLKRRNKRWNFYINSFVKNNGNFHLLIQYLLCQWYCFTNTKLNTKILDSNVLFDA